MQPISGPKSACLHSNANVTWNLLSKPYVHHVQINNINIKQQSQWVFMIRAQRVPVSPEKKETQFHIFSSNVTIFLLYLCSLLIVHGTVKSKWFTVINRPYFAHFANVHTHTYIHTRTHLIMAYHICCVSNRFSDALLVSDALRNASSTMHKVLFRCDKHKKNGIVQHNRPLNGSQTTYQVIKLLGTYIYLVAHLEKKSVQQNSLCQVDGKWDSYSIMALVKSCIKFDTARILFRWNLSSFLLTTISNTFVYCFYAGISMK